MAGKAKKILEKFGIWPVLALAAFFRFSRLAERDFWYDEAFTGIAARAAWPEFWQEIINDIHPPLYYLAVRFFGGFFDYSIFGLRLFSTICGLLAVWLVYLVAKEIFNRKTGLWSALITAVAPIAIQYSQEARMYSLLVCLFLTAAFFFIKGLKIGRKKYFLAWGAFLGLAALTHYMALILSPVFLAALIIYFFRSAEKRKLAYNFLTGIGAAFLIFLPWLNKFIFQLKSIEEKELIWVTPAKFSDIFLNIQMFLFGTPLGEMSQGMPQPNAIFFASPLTVLTAIIIAVCLITAAVVKNKGRNGLLAGVFGLGSLLIVFALSLAGKHYLVSRYVLPSAYFVFILIGAWLAQIKNKTAFFSFIAYILILLFGIDYVGYSTGWNKIAAEKEKYADSNAYILNSFDYVIAKYYLGDIKLFLYNFDWPQYDPQKWAGIGPNLKRIEDYQIMKNDSKAVIFSNGAPKIDPTEIFLAEKHDNILIYRFK